LLAYARRIRGLLCEAENRVAAEAGGAAVRLVLASSTTPAAFVLAPLVAEFVAQGRAEGTDLRVGNTDEVLAAVRDGVVALGVVEGAPHAAGVGFRHFLDDELVPVAAPARLSDERRRQLAAVRSLRDLGGLPLLWRESGSGTRRVVENALREAGLPLRELRQDYVFGGTPALKAAVLAGLGVGFLPRCAIEAELLLRSLVPVGRGLAIKRAFRWVVSAGGVPPPMAAFQRFAQQRVAARIRSA
jgi:DNA-binding transcriptional LysR family regulator